VLERVSCAREHLDVRPRVVRLVAVDVVHDLATPKRTAELRERNEAVLVRVPAHIGERVTDADLDQHVAVGRDGTSASPVRVA
jgi:hypothetical protein